MPSLRLPERCRLALRRECHAVLRRPSSSARRAATQVREIQGGREDTKVEQETCPDCGSSNLILDSRRAELVCSQCSVVVADALVLPGRERPSEDERYSVEADDSQLLPQLYFSSRDARGVQVGSNLVWLLRRTAQMQNLDSSQRSAVTMETRIRKLASQLQFPSTIALRAIYLFRKTRQVHVVKKPGLHHWALALLYTACRDSRYVITIEDLLGDPDDQRGKSTVWGYFKDIKRVLKLRLLPFSVENYITYYAGKLGPTIEGSTVSSAIHIARSSDIKLNSTPHCVAAGALYIALQEAGRDISQKGFCSYANVSEISLRHWVDALGGYTARKRDAPEVLSVDVADELQESQNVDAQRKQDADNDGENPSAPEQAEREQDRADDDENLDDGGTARNEVRKSAKVSAHPRRSLNLPKDARDERYGTTDGQHAKVKSHRVTARDLRPRSRGRTRARRSRRAR